MKYCCIVIIIALTMSCQGKKVSDSYVPIYTSQQLQDKIEKFYSLKSKDSILRFLSEWKDLIPASTLNFINQNDTTKNLFKIFEEMYRPFKFGNFDAENYFNSENEYILIQTDIEFAVYSEKDFQTYSLYSTNGFPNDSSRNAFKLKKLQNFRPIFDSVNTKYLYLTTEYKDALNNFLGVEHYETGEGDIMNTAFPKDETYNRYKFVCPTLPIVHGHWGGYWHLETFPKINSIIFDADFNQALVNFRVSIGQTVCDYRLVKIKGHWKPDKNETIRMTQE